VCCLSLKAITESAGGNLISGEAAILAHVDSCLQLREPALPSRKHPTDTTTTPTTTSPRPPSFDVNLD
jgi:hypothetical protein